MMNYEELKKDMEQRQAEFMALIDEHKGGRKVKFDTAASMRLAKELKTRWGIDGDKVSSTGLVYCLELANKNEKGAPIEPPTFAIVCIGDRGMCYSLKYKTSVAVENDEDAKDMVEEFFHMSKIVILAELMANDVLGAGEDENN